jgi:hypothetical protein
VLVVARRRRRHVGIAIARGVDGSDLLTIYVIVIPSSSSSSLQSKKSALVVVVVALARIIAGVIPRRRLLPTFVVEFRRSSVRRRLSQLAPTSFEDLIMT